MRHTSTGRHDTVPSPETVTRLRNTLALLAVELLDAPPDAARSGRSPLPFSSINPEHWRRAVLLWNRHADDVLATAEPRVCPACGRGESRQMFTSYDRHRFDECLGCGCWFTPRVIDWKTFERFFDVCPEGAALAQTMMEERGHPGSEAADLARIGGYFNELRPLIQAAEAETVAYLDAGCGVGHSLRAGLARGWRVQGVEVDTTALALARQAGLPVVTPADDLLSGPYHLVSFWETLEHIADPAGTLARYAAHLHDDGLVALTVPNLNALETRILREACPWVHGGYNTPGHVNLLHPASLDVLLQRAGLTLLDVRGDYSADPAALAAALSGRTRGALDSLLPSAGPSGLPLHVTELLNAIWPGAMPLEQVSLTSPILFAVACRTGRESLFAQSVRERRDQRRAAAAAVAKQLLEQEPDYKGMTASLERELEVREVLLKDLHRTAVEMQHALAAAQTEINLRDDRIDAARARFDRTIEGRLLSGARALVRLVRGRG